MVSFIIKLEGPGTLGDKLSVATNLRLLGYTLEQVAEHEYRVVGRPKPQADQRFPADFGQCRRCAARVTSARDAEGAHLCSVCRKLDVGSTGAS